MTVHLIQIKFISKYKDGFCKIYFSTNLIVVIELDTRTMKEYQNNNANQNWIVQFLQYANYPKSFCTYEASINNVVIRDKFSLWVGRYLFLKNFLATDNVYLFIFLILRKLNKFNIDLFKNIVQMCF